MFLVSVGAYDQMASDPEQGTGEGGVDSQEPAPSDCLSGTTIPTTHHEDGRFPIVIVHIVVRAQDDSKQLRQHIHHLHSQETRTHGTSQKIH